MALIYAAFGFLWAVTNDSLVAGPPNHDLIRTVKEWLFVVLSALLAYVLVDRSQFELDRTPERLEPALAHTSALHRILGHSIKNVCTVTLGYVELIEPWDNVGVNIDPVEVI